MKTLHIALNDGFQNDNVRITVDGRAIYEKSGVTTDLTISRADSLDVPVSAPQVEVRVEILSQGQSATEIVHPSETPFLGISIPEDGTVELKPSVERFLYM